MSFLGRLSRVAPPVTEEPSHAQPVTLGALRSRIQAILEKHAAPTPDVTRATDVDLPFVTEGTAAGDLHSRTLRLGAHRVGRAPVCLARLASSPLLALLALDPDLAACGPEDALYLDTETTGLAGGTGTVAFLVGLAFFHDGALVLEQLLVKNLGEEAPMLARLKERIEEASMLVTFNGKSFDMPLLRTRFAMARMAPPREPPHLDLLHVARRVHKARRRGSSGLVVLEREVLGFLREDDVPSGDVAGHYLHYLRTGDATALLAVVEHNAWDVGTMAALVGLYGEPLEGSRLEPADLVGVARTLCRAGEVDLAYDTVDRAVLAGAGPDSVRARGEISKARGDKARALADFEAFLEHVDDPAARLELTKLYEHHVKDPDRALAVLDGGTGETDVALDRRRARLDRKARKKRERVGAPLFDGRTKS